jgi:phage terminase small subunit
MGSITAQKQKFVNAYLVSNNATQAAIDAGYSERAASAQGSRLLKDRAIKYAIQQAQDEAKQRNQITVDDILKELEDARAIAKEERNAPAMISASMGKAKILGFDKQSHEVTVKPVTVRKTLADFYGEQPVTKESAAKAYMALING